MLKVNKGTVYLIYDCSSHLYKIGVTKSPIEKRIKQLQTGNGSELEVREIYDADYPYRMEKMLHLHFSNKRVKNEWFQLSETDAIGFINTCRHIDESIAILRSNPFFSKSLH